MELEAALDTARSDAQGTRRRSNSDSDKLSEPLLGPLQKIREYEVVAQPQVDVDIHAACTHVLIQLTLLTPRQENTSHSISLTHARTHARVYLLNPFCHSLAEKA